MKVFVTGACGQLGFDTVTELWRRGHEVAASDMLTEASGLPGGVEYVSLDITDAGAVRGALERIRPDAVIHCAAWTAVDAAEEPENREKVFAVNAGGTRNIALAARDIGCKMLYISTDYVFDGQGTEPWDADCKSFAPLNVYGESKLAGEEAVRELVEKMFIVRIAWVFGRHGKNFVKTMLRAGRTHDEVRVVCDQTGTPTYTPDLARLLVDMAATEEYGTYHATNEGGFISWYDYTKEIYRQAGLETHVTPVTSAEYGNSLAKRPFNSRLDKSKLGAHGFDRLPPWQDALRRYLSDMGEKVYE
ncbi:MAG: dTDP-4-dehydrorhamnose reductase [Clostridia bacterium]|nr:dTDP-4-dehydrorhamnose reductase [Clostridia bacterium]